MSGRCCRRWPSSFGARRSAGGGRISCSWPMRTGRALQRKVQANRNPRLAGGKAEARLTMLACSRPPEGHTRWSLRPLGDRLVELEIVDEIAGGTVRRAPKNNLKPWLKTCRYPAEGECRPLAPWMVLEVYARDYGAGTVLICPDETSRQQTKETRTPLPVRPGQPARYYFEYERGGTAGLIMLYASAGGWHHCLRHRPAHPARFRHGAQRLCRHSLSGKGHHPGD